MFATSRVVNTFRSVIPYASYVTVLINLGYAGYTAYSWYQEYLRQTELDARNNVFRSPEEVIELIIRPRRRIRRYAADDIQAQPTNNVDNNQSSQQSNGLSSSQSMYQFNNHTQNNEHHNPNPNNDETEFYNTNRSVQIIDISEVSPTSTSDPIEGPSGIGSKRNPIVIDDAEDDEILSTTSTSLESTDSNNGIVRDMYSECFICAQSLDNPNKIVATLPFCLHPFHKTCLDGVLKWHQKCPVCDFNIFSPI